MFEIQDDDGNWSLVKELPRKLQRLNNDLKTQMWVELQAQREYTELQNLFNIETREQSKWWEHFWKNKKQEVDQLQFTSEDSIKGAYDDSVSMALQWKEQTKELQRSYIANAWNIRQTLQNNI